MARFIIEPHFRLQEWIAHEKGYFADEGLDYEFRELIQSTDGKHHDRGDKQGAFQSFERGRHADVSCACHWTVNVAASKGHGRMSGEVYSVRETAIAATYPTDFHDNIGNATGRIADTAKALSAPGSCSALVADQPRHAVPDGYPDQAIPPPALG